MGKFRSYNLKASFPVSSAAFSAVVSSAAGREPITYPCFTEATDEQCTQTHTQCDVVAAEWKVTVFCEEAACLWEWKSECDFRQAWGGSGLELIALSWGEGDFSPACWVWRLSGASCLSLLLWKVSNAPKQTRERNAAAHTEQTGDYCVWGNKSTRSGTQNTNLRWPGGPGGKKHNIWQKEKVSEFKRFARYQQFSSATGAWIGGGRGWHRPHWIMIPQDESEHRTCRM